MDFLLAPWPWYVAGPTIGLTVPLLLLMGNKKLGISSTLRQICAACVPARIPLFQYDWK
jgi:tRNA G18 (ribose-2'-O)-methylase SpoU